MGIEILASAMGLPLYRRETKGKSTQTGKQYVPTDDDEVEDLYSLLETCKVIDCLMIALPPFQPSILDSTHFETNEQHKLSQK